MITDFKGKTAVLTGAGSGFGLECARIGARLGVPMELTLSCMQPVDSAHCGRCNKCRERREAFTAAGIEDRTTYVGF